MSNMCPFSPQNLMDVLWTEAKSQNNLRYGADGFECRIYISVQQDPTGNNSMLYVPDYLQFVTGS
jgi:hypothetical protein